MRFIKKIISKLLILFTLNLIVFFSYNLVLGQSFSNSNDTHVFAVYGDTRSDHSRHAEVLSQINESNPEFLFNTGDMVADGGEQSDWDIYNQIIENITFPIYTVVGNHEYESNSGLDWNLSVYLSNVDLPNNEIWYSFNAFNDSVHFIILNSIYYYFSNIENRSVEQNTWLLDDFETNNINTTIVLLHIPFWTLRDSRIEISNHLRNQWHNLFIEYDVDVVFCGHDHMYYRTNRDGICYITTGGGGAPIYWPNNLDALIDGDVYNTKNHFCEVTVTSRNLIIRVKDINGDILDKTTIEMDDSNRIISGYSFWITGFLRIIIIISEHRKMINNQK